ncbi:PAS domain-containing hybrid sensor histidine kinase/response regulator [Aliiglaciecola lipolytica]|uniref:PAS domain-containing hybrid sensor histidine kinase/response regulator n=1 Tax=Aliiglaciecola lipolytica TaxID=477689 RepID=UPI00068A3F4F|nr:PAS domain-containing sensor histidine kinase [Aliiglaciecola lipolytica]
MVNTTTLIPLDVIRDRLSNTLTVTAAAFVIFAVAASLSRIPAIGFLPVMKLQIVAAVSVLGVYFFRHKLSYRFKATIICSLFFIAGVAGVHTFGIAGSSIYMLLAASLYSSFILGTFVAAIFSFLGGLVIAFYMLLSQLGFYEFQIEQSAYGLSLGGWATHLLVYSYVCGIALFLSHHFFNYLQKLLVQQKTIIASQHTKIEESEAILQTVINQLPFSILWKDTSHRYIGANRRFMEDSGVRDIAQLIGKTDHDVVDKELADQFYELDEQIITGKKDRIHFEAKHENIHGESVYSEIDRVPLLTNQNQLLGVLVSYHDVTERKLLDISTQQAKQEAELANKAKSQFLANMSHEIRTPINGVLGLIDLCMHTSLNQQQKGYLIRADHTAKILLQIINDILDLSKIEAGHLQLESIPFNFEPMLDQLSSMFDQQCTSKGIGFSTEFVGPNQVFLLGDPTRLMQVMINLTSNAIKFTASGNVKVALKMVTNESEAKVKLTVTDSGIGIPTAAIPRLFDNFTQADDAVTRKHGGTGLGLAIVKNMIDAMGGQIKVNSEVDKGTEFVVTLTFKRTLAPNEEDAQSIEKVDLSDKHILLAEDNLINQEIAISMLEQAGARVSVALNGQQAIDLLEIEKFDLVLLDIQMPIMDGCTAIQIIRQSANYADLPIIAITANVMAEEIAFYQEIGFNAHIGKPFARSQLLHIVSSYITEPH